jgi:hypothetical protein
MNIFLSIDGKNSSSEFINNLLNIENSYVIVCAKRVSQQFFRYSMGLCSPTLARIYVLQEFILRVSAR